MKRVVWYVSDLIACGMVRGVVPAAGINRRFGKEWTVDVKNVFVYSDLERCDAMVFQRADNPLQLEWMREAQKRGIACIYDLDDNFWEMPDGCPTDQPGKTLRDFYTSRLPVIEEGIRLADLVTASTPTMAAKIAHKTGVFPEVVRNCVDPVMWSPGFDDSLSDIRRDRSTVTLGWVASGTHVVDAPLVMPAIERVMNARPHVRLRLAGWVGTVPLEFAAKFERGRVMVGDWIPYDCLPAALASLDVATACVADSPFNACKSECKWQEAAIAAVPCVVSDAPPYADVWHCWRAKNTPDGWFDALLAAVDMHHGERRLMGFNAHMECVSNHSTEIRAEKWVEVFQRAVDVRFARQRVAESAARA